jgi:hypothetical protein
LKSFNLLPPPLTKASNINFSYLKKHLDLIVDNSGILEFGDEIDPPLPHDSSYYYSGYAPLSARLIESQIPEVFSSKQKQYALDSILPVSGNIPDDLDQLFSLRNIGSACAAIRSVIHQSVGIEMPSKKRTCVFFIGGCTRAEISVLRRRKVHVFTTEIISGEALMSRVEQAVLEV